MEHVVKVGDSTLINGEVAMPVMPGANVVQIKLDGFLMRIPEDESPIPMSRRGRISPKEVSAPTTSCDVTVAKSTVSKGGAFVAEFVPGMIVQVQGTVAAIELGGSEARAKIALVGEDKPIEVLGAISDLLPSLNAEII